MIFFDSLALRTSPWTGQCFLQRWGAMPWASTLPRGSCCCPPAAAHLLSWAQPKAPVPGQRAAPAIRVCFLPLPWGPVTHLNTREDGLVGHYRVLKDWISGAACMTLFRDTEQGGKNEAKGFFSSLHTQIQHIRINSHRNTSCFEREGSFSCPSAHLLGAQLWRTKLQPGLQLLTTPIYIHATSSSQVIDCTVVSMDFIAAQPLKEELAGAIKSSNACLADTMRTAQQLPTSAYSQNQCFHFCLIIQSLTKVNLS